MLKRVAQTLAGAVLLVGVVGLGTASCRQDEPQAVGAVARVEAQTAQARIAQVRCDLEQRCNRLGENRDFANRDACVSGIQTSWLKGLEGDQCDKGVDRAALDKCVTELQRCTCDQPMTTVAGLVECRTSDLCK